MRRPSSLLPPEQLSAVVTALYKDAERHGWTTLSPGDRTRTYSSWIDDPRVGGILTQYMSPEAARSWIKDGPMKEYTRASRGAGRYAEWGREGGTGPTEVAVAALGEDASVVPGSAGVKPFHCHATTPNGATAYIAWGEARNFRNLLWDALRTSVQEGVTGHIVVTEPPGLVTQPDQIRAHQALTRRCGLRLHYMRETLGNAASGSSA